ncbi:MAG: hypothetical protein APR54_12050 [Candidatus Cloacimonas sp. SDB]|nr:MAG: hypothetical protein APR54_12050 [Candidatus Cloacimonas sp. SDB]
MKGRKNIELILFIFLLISLSFSLTSQAEEVGQDSQFLNKIILCRDIKENEPVYQTNTFRSWDDKVVAWISFNYQSQEPFLLTWEWIDPDGKIYHIGEIEMDSGNYRNYRSWYWINVWDHYAAKLPGEWKVRLYIEELLLAEKNFIIE